MAKRPTVTTVASGFYSNTTLNNNFTAIRDQFDNTLSLDGSTPNAMQADLDLNGNSILNANVIEASVVNLNGSPVNTANATSFSLVDGVSTPATTTGYASIFIDQADGDLKIKFGDGTVKTIVVDT